MNAPRTVYLASAVDQSKNPALYNEVKKVLVSRGSVTIYDPKTAFSVPPELVLPGDSEEANDWSYFIFAINTRALRKADLRVFVLETGAASWGVPLELDLTVREGLPFLLVMYADCPIPAYLRTLLAQSAAWISDVGELDLVTVLYRNINPQKPIHVWASQGANQ